MKNFLLSLLIISPLAKSEMLELTCTSAFPFWVSVDLATKKGTVTYVDFPIDDAFLNKAGRRFKPEIKKFLTLGDYYVIYNGGIPANHRNPPHRLAINRKNLNFFLEIGSDLVSRSGTCEIGIKALPNYQI